MDGFDFEEDFFHFPFMKELEIGTIVNLNGEDPDSLIWKHDTLYTPKIKQGYAGKNKKTREWVQWRFQGSNISETDLLPVIIRSTDWLPRVEKFRLVALTHTENKGGWRSFEITAEMKRAKVEKQIIHAEYINVRGPNGEIITLQQALDLLWSK